MWVCVYAEMLRKRSTGKLRRELLIGFDPVRLLLQHIQQRCEGSATFLVDIFGGQVIGVKLNDNLMRAGSLDLNHASSLEPVKQSSTGRALSCKLAVPVVMSDIKALGAGLVSHIALQASNR